MSKTPVAQLEKTRIALSFKIAAVALSTVALFRLDLTILLSDALRSETTSYLLAIPPLLIYLIYRKRKMLRAVVPLENENWPKEIRHLPLIAGILLVTTAILLYWHGSYTFTPLEYHMLALPIFAAGLTLTLFNPQTLRQLAFPIAFLTFLIPLPSEILYALGSKLSVISSVVSNAIVNAFGIPSTLTSEYGNPTIVITRPEGTPLQFTVDIACSGIHSLIGFLIFAVFIAYAIRDKAWKKFALFLSGILLIYLLNLVRILTIIMVGYHYGEEIPLQTFQLLGGWILIFLGTLLLLTISEKIFKTQIFASTKPKCSQCNPTPNSTKNFCTACGRILKPSDVLIKKSDAAKITAITLAVTLLMTIQAPVFALTPTYPIVVTNTPSGQQVSSNILPQISSHTLNLAYRDTVFEQTAKQDMSLVYLYSPSNESKEPVWVAVEIASTRSSLHNWETDLITWPLSMGYQPRVAQVELKDIKINENPPIVTRYFVFTYTATNQIQAVLYWYETAIFTIDNSTLQQKNIKISLIAYPEDTESLPEIESQLVTLATQILNYWQPIKTWSQITLIISKSGTTLTLASATVLLAIIVFYAFETRKQKESNAKACQKLSNINKQIINIVRQTEKRTTPTLDNIAETYQKATQQPIDKNQLLQKLIELEKTDIIKGQITNKQDEPTQTWKTQC